MGCRAHIRIVHRPMSSVRVPKREARGARSPACLTTELWIVRRSAAAAARRVSGRAPYPGARPSAAPESLASGYLWLTAQQSRAVRAHGRLVGLTGVSCVEVIG